jgi:hypothetical protein
MWMAKHREAGTHGTEKIGGNSSVFSSIANFYWGTAERAPLALIW